MIILWIAIGIGIFLLGGFGADMLKEAISFELSGRTSSRIVFLLEHLRITVEEFAELVGETLILNAFAILVQRTLNPKNSPTISSTKPAQF